MSNYKFSAQELYNALDDYCDCTTDLKDNQETRATITSFLSWLEESTHEPSQEELDEYYRSIASPYGGAL